MVKLIANYAKKLGLPGFSSHQFSVSVETELHGVEDIAATSEKLYKQLQEAVDEQMQNYGFVPPDGYGMDPKQGVPYGNGSNGHARNGTNGHSQNGNGSSSYSHSGNGQQQQRDVWRCTEGQKGLILRVVHEHKLNKDEVEEMSQQLFRCGVTDMDKMQASQLIEDLLEKVGKKPAGQRRWGNQQGARS